jgi:hypothetical protein
MEAVTAGVPVGGVEAAGRAISGGGPDPGLEDAAGRIWATAPA